MISSQNRKKFLMFMTKLIFPEEWKLNLYFQTQTLIFRSRAIQKQIIPSSFSHDSTT